MNWDYDLKIINLTDYLIGSYGQSLAGMVTSRGEAEDGIYNFK